jgi:primosomal protein N' (replication factor Y) (superfamily II helicase)
MSDITFSKYDTYADVILPLAIAQHYTYRVSIEDVQKIKIGSRVIVPFQGNRLYTAIVLKIHSNSPSNYTAKYILNVLDEQAVLSIKQLELWQWIAKYYVCTTGEVMNAALPTALKLTSETKVVINKDAEFDKDDLSDKEYLIVEAIQIQESISIQDIQKILDQKTVMPLIKQMIQKSYILLEEELQEKYKAKTLKHLVLKELFEDPPMLRSLFIELEKRPKQLDVLQAYLQLKKHHELVSQKMLSEMGLSSSAVQTLIKNEIFELQESIVSRLKNNSSDTQLSFNLNEEQQQAFIEIKEAFELNMPVLLYGITSSGKTILYIELIKEQLAKGKQVLILVPEIGLTTQLIERYKVHFTEDIGVYHSRYTENQRAEVWQETLKSNYKIILGTRSAIFLPYENLGLIIVDEEHDPSYKQNEPNPRYNARDVSIFMAHHYNANVILGTATPSIESYYNSIQKKYKLVCLKNRFGSANLPETLIVPLQNDLDKENNQQLFGKTLLHEIEIRLAKKEQVILFQNRRGYAPFLHCNNCGHSPQCNQCDVSLTYHKWKNELRCHYCGYHTPVLKVCPSCGSSHLQMMGLGTEKIEEELEVLFPHAKIARMDLDTTRRKNTLQELVNDFENGEIDILVGTQMVTKGLDFEKVTLVGIIQADTLINHPDFRSHERAFQLIEQVSGRAGRRAEQGKVIIQTNKPEHPILQLASRHDYDAFLKQQLLERKQFYYPPFVRLIEITLKHKDSHKVQLAAQNLSKELTQLFGIKAVLGPEFPAVSRIRNQYIQKILLKLDRTQLNLEKSKEIIRIKIAELKSKKDYSACTILVDVDPI